MRNNDEIKKRFHELTTTIEDAKIYDGRGTFDLYACILCGHGKITTYYDKGVIPFMIACNCGSNMQHIKSYKSMPDHIEVHK